MNTRYKIHFDQLIFLFAWLLSINGQTHAASPLKAQLKKIDNLIAAGKYDDAIARLRFLEKEFHKQPELQAELAMACMYKGDNNSACQAAASALAKDPKNHEAHWVLANVYMALDLKDKSAQEYQLSNKYKSRKACKPCAKRSQELLKSLKH